MPCSKGWCLRCGVYDGGFDDGDGSCCVDDGGVDGVGFMMWGL